jgi:Peptidase M15
MSTILSTFVQRASTGVCFVLTAFAVLIAVTAGAEARTKDVPLSARAEIWRGYGEHGYIVKAREPRRSALSKRSFRAAIAASGYAAKSATRKSRATKYAALNSSISDVRPKSSITGGGSGGAGVRWLASSGCLDGTLVALINNVAAHYGSVTVNSTCRSRGHNAAVGGAKRSQHLTGSAVDFRVHGNYGGVVAYMRSFGGIGGAHHYGGGLFHADVGPKRSW